MMVGLYQSHVIWGNKNGQSNRDIGVGKEKSQQVEA